MIPLLWAQAIAPIQSVTPDSLFGWGGFVFGLIACGILVWDKISGRAKNIASIDRKIDGLCDKVEDLEGGLEVVDGLTRSVNELIFEWRGVDGSNGYKSIVKDIRERLRLIEKRNDKLDAIREAREEDERRSGGLHRRQMDHKLNNLLPNEREEKE